MNLQKATQKSVEALQNAQRLASEYGNQQLEEAHLALALLSASDGLIPGLFEKMGISVDAAKNALRAAVEKYPKVSGGGREAD